MIQIAKGMTEDEIKAAADYFGSMKWTPWIKVMESKTVPKTRIQGGMYLRLEGNETEPLGMRIIETPENVEHTETLRNPRSGFIAYVPMGSIKKGEELVTTGWQGQDGAVRVLPRCRSEGAWAGARSRRPLTELRRPADVRHAGRRAPWRVDGSDEARSVAKLTDEDFVSIAAYLSSRMP
jgi:hypothetical protein